MFSFKSFFKKSISFVTILAFVLSNTGLSWAQGSVAGVTLPAPGARINVSSVFSPPVLKGIRVNAMNPLAFDFFLDTGHADYPDQALTQEAGKLIRYFLTALTVPATDMWVNLSPYESDRIIPQGFGETEMGRDLLAQDYLLKQITASLLYPEGDIGKSFWSKVYQKAFEEFGSTDIPMDTFNKVWIVPNKARIFEKGTKAFVISADLKVMLETDYAAEQGEAISARLAPRAESLETRQLSNRFIREVIIPVLEEEINQGKNFASLRQIYFSLVLARWYQDNIKGDLLNEQYAGQNKVRGIDGVDRTAKGIIYQRYLQAFKTGVFNYVKEEYDPNSEETLPRKYFSGGFDFAQAIVVEKTIDLGAPAVLATGTLVEIAGVYSPVARPVMTQGDFAQLTEVPVAEETKKEQRDVDARAAASSAWGLMVWSNEVAGIFANPQPTVEDMAKVVIELRKDPLARILDHIKPGDWLMGFRQPGTTMGGFGIKDWNTQFGQERTNKLIGFIQETLRAEMKTVGLAASSRDIVYSTYKESFFRVGRDVAADEQTLQRQLFQVRQNLLAAVNNFLQTDEDFKGFFPTEESLKYNNQFRFEIDFGVGIVRDEGLDAEAQDRAKVAAMMDVGSLIGLKRSGLVPVEAVPLVFSMDNLAVIAKQTAGLRADLGSLRSLWETDATTGYLVLEKDIRKTLRQQTPWENLSGDMQARFFSKENWQKLQRYFAAIATYDFIKQWQLDFNEARGLSREKSELADKLESLQEALRQNQLEDIKNRQDTLAQAWSLLSVDTKAPDFFSGLHFYAKGSQYTEAALVTIDIVDMGGKNIREIEILDQSINEILASVEYDVARLAPSQQGQINQLRMTAMDVVTADFQARLRKVISYLKQEGLTVAASRLGGDEFDIVIENGALVTPVVLLEIKKIMGARVAGIYTSQPESAGNVDLVQQSFKNRTEFKLLDATETHPQLVGFVTFADKLLLLEQGVSFLKDMEKEGDASSVVMLRAVDGQLVWTKLTPQDNGYSIATIDEAQAVDQTKGGIDFNPSLIDVRAEGRNNDWSWLAGVADADSVYIDGLVPEVSTLSPVFNISQLLEAAH